MRLQFLLCGRPDDAFMSQVAVFKLALHALGRPYSDARIGMSLDRFEPIPDRWKPLLADVDFAYAPHDHWDYVAEKDGKHGNTKLHCFDLMDPEADVCLVCDADTLLLQSFDADFLESLMLSPAICGVIAHFPPRRTDTANHDWEEVPIPEFWNILGRHVIGRDLPLRFFHSVSQPPVPCPFYINYGLVASTPGLLWQLNGALHELQPLVREVLDNEFYGQIGIALATEKLGLPVRELPMRYNFPNDTLADAKHPSEMQDIRLIHYLRTEIFDRHLIFTNRTEFDRFLSLELAGSNKIFQSRIRELTGGLYPFPDV